MIVMLKTIGYFISVISVLLLGAAAWRTASHDPTLLLCLIGGMIASMIGMLLRWISHLMDQREKEKLARS
jgi:nicotinamide riboside transporter PnuC